MEMLVWGYLRTRPLGFRFRRQHPLYNYIADFYCLALSLIIEIDGDVHNEPGVKAYDEERKRIIVSLGIQILRFTNNEVLYNLDVVIENTNSFIQNTLTKKQKEGMLTPPLGGRGVCSQ